jgi:tetratricopeptide (TPR) repeat protein
MVNSEVPKLAGIIAYRRGQPNVARERFELARRRNREDCEVSYYLGLILAEQRVWDRTAEVLVEAVACFERAEATLNEEIAAIRASTQTPQRQQRQIARRAEQIARNRRMIATSRYDAAVSYFSLSRKDEARTLADRLVDDEQFGDRARELLARLKSGGR